MLEEPLEETLEAPGFPPRRPPRDSSKAPGGSEKILQLTHDKSLFRGELPHVFLSVLIWISSCEAEESIQQYMRIQFYRRYSRSNVCIFDWRFIKLKLFRSHLIRSFGNGFYLCTIVFICFFLCRPTVRRIPPTHWQRNRIQVWILDECFEYTSETDISTYILCLFNSSSSISLSYPD